MSTPSVSTRTDRCHPRASRCFFPCRQRSLFRVCWNRVNPPFAHDIPGEHRAPISQCGAPARQRSARPTQWTRPCTIMVLARACWARGPKAAPLTRLGSMTPKSLRSGAEISRLNKTRARDGDAPFQLSQFEHWADRQTAVAPNSQVPVNRGWRMTEFQKSDAVNNVKRSLVCKARRPEATAMSSIPPEPGARS
jgi:hypothetical protein